MEIEYFVDQIFNLIFVIVSLIICKKIASADFKLKQKISLYIGFGFMGLAISYVPNTLNFLSFLIFEKSLNQVTFLSLYWLIPIAVVLWLFGMKELLVIRRKMIFITLSLFFIFLSLIYVIFLVIDPNWIGYFTDKSHTYISFTSFTKLFLISCLITFLTTGLIFSLKCLRSDSLDVILKGKLLLLGFVSFTVGVLMANGFEVELYLLFAPNLNFTIFVYLYFLFLILIILITGFFCLKSVRDDSSEIKLRGKLLLIGFLSFCVVFVMISTSIRIDIIRIMRIILTSASIEFYFGFMMPDWVKKRFLRN